MAEELDLDGIPEEELGSFLEWRQKVSGANINPQTLLATDYLNHFNEIVMMLEMLPDCPECIEEAKEWHPKTYPEHFQDSGFKDKELAIEAYNHVPSKFRRPFEQAVEQMNRLVQTTISRFEAAMTDGRSPDEERIFVSEATQLLQRLGELTSAIIHGSTKAMDQEEIDILLGEH
ncbi:MAG: hypothetical protein HQL44_14610 [Alphaproteobacteria bacterium]|nr:hypothetical protein [Alphaproteobacteria bacterium]